MQMNIFEQVQKVFMTTQPNGVPSSLLWWPFFVKSLSCPAVRRATLAWEGSKKSHNQNKQNFLCVCVCVGVDEDQVVWITQGKRLLVFQMVLLF